MKKIISVAIVLAVLSSVVLAQEEKEHPRLKYPQLNGHTFPTFVTLKSSFINTSFRARIGLGQASKLEVPGISIGDYEIFTYGGKLLFANLNILYQQRFNHFLALYISFELSARLGTDMSTILVDGVNTMSGGEIGWLVKIYQGRKINLSASIALRNFSGSFINVSNYFSDIINNVPDPAVVKVVPALSVGAGFHLAYAINPTFGIQAGGGYAYGESFTRDKNEGYFNFGIAGDVDFNPAKKVPIGLTFGYTLTTFPEVMMNYDGPSDMFIVMISYTGSQNFELGLQYIFYSMESPAYTNTANINNATIMMKYYF